MKRKDFLKSLGVLPAAFFLPSVFNGRESNMRVWSAGFWGNDKSLTIGGHNELDEQFFITYRKLHPKIMIPSYESWKEHFDPALSRKFIHRHKNYKEAARADWSTKELFDRRRDNIRRFPFSDGFDITAEDTKHKEEYFTRMAEWCERMAEQFRSIK